MSHSTEKLTVLTEAIKNIPPDKLNKVKSFELFWTNIEVRDDKNVVVPCIRVEFFN